MFFSYRSLLGFAIVTFQWSLGLFILGAVVPTIIYHFEDTGSLPDITPDGRSVADVNHEAHTIRLVAFISGGYVLLLSAILAGFAYSEKKYVELGEQYVRQGEPETVVG